MVKRDNRDVLLLAYQSFGVIFSDLGISPLYVYRVTFSGKLRHHQSEEVIFGAFSLIFWTLTFFSLLKYAIFMLTTDDNGEGGIFAVYSLLCRHAKLSLLPNHQAADEELSTYHYPHNCLTRTTLKCKRSTELLKRRKTFLLLLVLFSASMTVSIAVLTPAITVLSSVEGLQVRTKHFDKRMVLDVSCVLLVCVFVMQHRGTQKATSVLSPIMIFWLFSIAAIGVHNILAWNRSVLWALSPSYIFKFFHHTGRDGLVSLGGIILCVTGTEAIFAYRGRFTATSIRMAFVFAVYPCLVLQYMGQAAFLSKNSRAFTTSFHASIPDPVFWPVYVMAILVAVIASQSAIAGSCSVIKQSHSFGCFRRIKVLHSSRWIEGQIYIPELNWILMVLCLAITIGFRNMNRIGNAYGIAWIMMTMVMTLLTPLVIKLVWNKNLVFAISFFILYEPIEMIFLLSTCHGIPTGGWASLIISATFTFIMFVWHFAARKKFLYDQHNKVPLKWIMTLGPSLGVIRVPGIGLFFTELASGIPSSFTHFLDNLPVFYQVAVFVCVKTVPVPHVPHKERYLIGRIGPKSYRLYRCIVRNGYKDVNRKEEDFENDLILCLAEFVQLEAEGSGTVQRSTDGRMAVVGPTENFWTRVETLDASVVLGGGTKSTVLQKLQAMYIKESSQPIHSRSVQFKVHETRFKDPGVKEELLELVEAKGAGVTYIIGHAHVKLMSHSSFLKKFVIHVAYSFLRKNSRSPSVALNIPQVCLIEVGVNYHV